MDRRCSHCQEVVQPAASVCPHCRGWIGPFLSEPLGLGFTTGGLAFVFFLFTFAVTSLGLISWHELQRLAEVFAIASA